ARRVSYGAQRRHGTGSPHIGRARAASSSPAPSAFRTAPSSCIELALLFAPADSRAYFLIVPPRRAAGFSKEAAAKQADAHVCSTAALGIGMERVTSSGRTSGSPASRPLE